MRQQNEHTRAHHRLDKQPKALQPPTTAPLMRTHLGICGMVCPRCLILTRDALAVLDGVLLVDVSLDRSIIMVLYDPCRLVLEDLLDAVEGAGGTDFVYDAVALTCCPVVLEDQTSRTATSDG